MSEIQDEMRRRAWAAYGEANDIHPSDWTVARRAFAAGWDAGLAPYTGELVAHEIEVYATDLRDQATALLTGELTTDQGRDLMRIYRGLTIAARIARGDQP